MFMDGFLAPSPAVGYQRADAPIPPQPPEAPVRLLLALVPALLLGCNEPSVTGRTDQEDPRDEDTDVEVDPELPIPVASAPLYAQTSGELFEIDPSNGDVVELGTFRTEDGTEVSGFVDIAIDLEGRLFGGTFDHFYRIDPETAEVSIVCDWIGEPPFALAFTSEGELVAGAGREIRIIDIDTCQDRALLRDSDFETSGDLVGLPDGYLYWSVRGERDQPDELVRIDPSNGRTEWLGIIGFEKLFGMAYFEDRLYGFSDDGSMVRIEPGNANSFLLGRTADKRWYGATTNPVLWGEDE